MLCSSSCTSCLPSADACAASTTRRVARSREERAATHARSGEARPASTAAPTHGSTRGAAAALQRAATRRGAALPRHRSAGNASVSADIARRRASKLLGRGGARLRRRVGGHVRRSLLPVQRFTPCTPPGAAPRLCCFRCRETTAAATALAAASLALAPLRGHAHGCVPGECAAHVCWHRARGARGAGFGDRCAAGYAQTRLGDRARWLPDAARQTCGTRRRQCLMRASSRWSGCTRSTAGTMRRVLAPYTRARVNEPPRRRRIWRSRSMQT
jgi:hypothetical protein